MPRPHLNKQLTEGICRKLILISAPAGFGKTTLLSDWIDQGKMPVAWLSLDRNDNNPEDLLTYMVAALQTIEADIGRAILTSLQSPQKPPVESILTNIINDIVPVEKDFVFVLDDYHLVDNKQIHHMTAFLLDHQPQQMHIVIATRSDPPLPLSRLRSQNQMIELRAADLSFTADEASIFFNKTMKLQLTPDEIETLDSRTEGWIAGLQLAAISLQGRKDRSGFVEGFKGDNRYIADYLVEEVLNRQPERVQNFLLQTSILSRLSGPLCDAVINRNDSQQMLDTVETANLLIVPLDDERSWYRYHHLFADLLRQRLHQAMPEQVNRLHRRASVWFEQEGLTAEAILHALAIQDYERAADILEPAAPLMITESKPSALLSWLERLPDEIVETRPWLSVSGAWANLLSDRTDAVEPLLQSAEARLNKGNNAVIRCNIMAIRAHIARYRGDLERSVELSHKALRNLPQGDLIVQSAIMINLGIAYFKSGDMASAHQYLEECSAFAQAGGNLYAALTAISYLAEIQTYQGNLHEAAKIYRQEIQLGTEMGGGRPLPAAGYGYVGLGRLLYEWNELDEAESLLTQGIELGEQIEESVILLKGYLALARLRQVLGDGGASMEAIEMAEAIVPKAGRVMEARHVSGWRARLWMMQGNPDKASRWADSQGARLNLHEVPDFQSEMPYLTLIRVHIVRDEIDDIPALLKRLHHVAEANERTGSIIEILILQSIAMYAQGKLDQSLSALARALSLAEPEGYVRIFIDEGPPMAELLEKILDMEEVDLGKGKAGFSKAYVNRLLLSFRASSLPRTDGGLIDPLSQRELDVLQLVAAGLSNQDIATKLFVSLNTVKTHLKNINSKLNVHSRTQATARAKDLGLLLP